MKRQLSDPRLYWTWTVLLIAGLCAAYGSNPYLFGFAVFVLGAATGLICIVGTLSVVIAQGANRSAKLAVLASLLVSGAAVLGALVILDRFHWA